MSKSYSSFASSAAASSAADGASAVSVARNKLRSDLQVISDMIPPHIRVLDLGCGDGMLLEYLVTQKDVVGRGVELSEEDILACVRRGLSVRQGNLEEGLADYPNDSFDYVILSQTLPFLDDPAMVVREMLRVGSHAIVSFSNWGYWRCRLEMLFTGRIPQAPDLPHRWYEPPRWQAFTVADFGRFSRHIGVRVSEQVYLSGNRRLPRTRYKNLLATTAVFTLEKL